MKASESPSGLLDSEQPTTSSTDGLEGCELLRSRRFAFRFRLVGLEDLPDSPGPTSHQQQSLHDQPTEPLTHEQFSQLR